VIISELAAKTGITTKAIRFYEAEGVLPTPKRAANGYREYTDDDLCRLRLVVTLRSIGSDLARKWPSRDAVPLRTL
jgi:DNA-binding transcriptional MerR regulator